MSVEDNIAEGRRLVEALGVLKRRGSTTSVDGAAGDGFVPCLEWIHWMRPGMTWLPVLMQRR